MHARNPAAADALNSPQGTPEPASDIHPAQADGKGVADFFKALSLGLPVVLGYLPLAFAFGILGSQAGLSVASATLMSLLVYAGSGQYIAVGLIMSGASPMNIVFTTFIVNLRHLLMSASLSPYLGKWPKKEQVAFTLQMTDETYALNMGRFISLGVNKRHAFAINLVSHAAWISGSAAGAAFSGALGSRVQQFGLDYALCAMFIALILPHLRIPRRLCAVLAGFAMALGFGLAGAGQWTVMLATLGAATVAAALPLPAQKGRATA